MRPQRILWSLLLLAAIALSGTAIHRLQRDSAPDTSQSTGRSIRPPQLSVTPLRPKLADSATPANASFVAQERFPGCPVIESREEHVSGDRFRRFEVVKTNKKYPFIRLETLFERDAATEQEKILTVQEYVADQVAIDLREGKSEADLNGAIASIDGRILRRLDLDYAQTFLVVLPHATIDAVPEAIRRLSLSADIIAVADVNGISRKQVTPNDPSFSQSWHLNASGDIDVDAAEAWAVHTGSRSVIIGISDTGVDYNHPDLVNNIWSNPGERAEDGYDEDRNNYMDDVRGWDFVSGDNSPMDLDSSGGHGTQVAGIIGAVGNNGRGTAGVMWSCQLIPLRVLDEDGGGFYSDIAEAFTYARRAGAKIINASHGGDTGSSLIQQAVSSLQSAGVLLVAPAGNESRNTDVYPLYPASYPNPNIISVAASTSSDTLAYFSNYGQTSVDLAAPGSSIYSTAPGGFYDTTSGTSFSAPLVAGMAGLLKAKNPTWTYQQIREALLNNVDRRTALAGQCVTGGRANLYKAIMPRTSLAAALDSSGLTWSTGGHSPWWGAVSGSSDWVESGGIDGSQQCWIRTIVSGPATISFSWKVSSESGYDILDFQIDGVVKASISGAVNWARRSFSVGPGNHTLLWTYSKDGWVSGGSDTASLDNVTVVGVAPKVTSHPLSRMVNAGANVSFSVSTYGTPPLRYQWFKNGVAISSATNQTFAITNAQTVQAGSYFVQVRNAYGQTNSNPATLSFCSTSVSPSVAAFGPGGGTRLVTVSTSGGCSWSASTTNQWISLTSSTSGQGSGAINYVVAPNQQVYTRIGAIHVQGRKVIVTQTGKLAPASALMRNFFLTITNATGTAASSGSFLVRATSTNTFRVIPITDTILPASGAFGYTATGNTALLVLGRESSATNVQLRFTSPSGVQFSSTMPDGSAQSGFFVLAPVRPDFNGDGNNDLLLMNSNRVLNAWVMRGTNFAWSRRLNTLPLDPGWRVVGVGGITNAFSPDVVFQAANGQLVAWLMPSGTNVSGVVQLRPGTPVPNGLKAVGLHDFNRDGKTDILMQHSDRRASVWLMNGTQFIRSAFLNSGVPASAGWEICGVSDFNDDGEGDVLWQHEDGRLAAWTLVGLEFVASIPVCDNRTPGAAWRLAAINDLNRDGRNDLLFQHTDGRLLAWFLQQATFRGGAFIQNGQPAASAGRVLAPR